MRCLSLFSGYGGLDLAVQQVFPTARVDWCAEIEPAPARVMAHRFPGAVNLGDVTKIDWLDSIRACEKRGDATDSQIDILTAGYP